MKEFDFTPKADGYTKSSQWSEFQFYLEFLWDSNILSYQIYLLYSKIIEQKPARYENYKVWSVIGISMLPWFPVRSKYTFFPNLFLHLSLLHINVTILKILSLTLRIEGYTTTVFMISEAIITITLNETHNPIPNWIDGIKLMIRFIWYREFKSRRLIFQP